VENAYFYLGGDPLHTGIYVDMIGRLGDEGLDVALVSRLRVSPAPSALWRAWRERERIGPNRVADIRRRVPAGVHQLPGWNALPELSVPRLARILGPASPRGRRVVVHTRQMVMARLALALKRRWPALRVIVELEGDDMAELDYRRTKAARPSPALRARWALEGRYYRREEQRILTRSDAVICVSEKLREVMVRRFSLPSDRAERVHAIATPASRKEFVFDPARRERTRAALDLQDRFVAVYAGTLRSAWQLPGKLVDAFACIREARPRAFFLVLTPDADRRHIEPHLQRAGIPPEDYRLRSCPHAEIVDHLCAADIGLLVRDRHPMNEVAAPGKLAEYALTGLPVVMTEGLGDFSEPMRASRLACVLPDVNDAGDMRERIRRFCVRDFGPRERAAFGAWAAARFATELGVPRIAALYRSV